MLAGVFLSFLAYLGTLPRGEPAAPQEAAGTAQEAVPQPRFDFYTMLPEQSLDEDLPAGTQATQPAARPAQASKDYYLLQAGSFRQREDADRRRAELLLLGLEPTIRESDSDNGRWFRVYLGPFESHSKVTRARSLTAAQGIDTLLLKRPAQG
ncbi:sporulation protein [Mangrovimicrobium sediminis]|uniref:Sporulation protein n=2 Tax=Mangrovimicrobium sediminis TaxID=2562682 RepID=A0A4Z0M0X4_9GAMM|nr:sporulation protein [Haliea sp. SAOS-164]